MGKKLSLYKLANLSSRLCYIIISDFCIVVYICLYISRHVWKTEVLNWPAGQPLNLTCSIRKIHEEDDNQIRDENNDSSLHGEY